MSEYDPKKSKPHVAAQLAGKSWEDLEALEESGDLLFPAELHKPKKGGGFDEIPILLKIPRGPELRKARRDARQQAEKEGMDLERDKDLIEDLEIVHILAYAIRSRTPMEGDDGPTYEPFDPFPEELEKTYDRRSLAKVWTTLNRLIEMIDPAPSEIDENEMIGLMAAIAKAGNVVPLAVYGPGSQATFITFMASQLVNSLASRSLPDFIARLTRES